MGRQRPVDGWCGTMQASAMTLTEQRAGEFGSHGSACRSQDVLHGGAASGRPEDRVAHSILAGSGRTF